MRRVEQLAAAIERHAPATGLNQTPLTRLSLFRANRPTLPAPWVYDASLCLIAQGAKQVLAGDQTLFYDASRYLVVSVDMPLTGHVIEAEPDAPYLCCKLDLDAAALADLVMAEPARTAAGDCPTLAVYPGDPNLIDAACRLVLLLEQPATIPALAPLIEREILYRLLTGPHSPTLRRLVAGDSQLNRVSRAIAQIRARFRERLRIREIAAAAGMSESSLHEHFKSVTRLTPLEFQKQLRLQEARRLMLVDGASAGTAGFAVGYESPSQFSREYCRLFGAPPRQDIGRLQSNPDYFSAV